MNGNIQDPTGQAGGPAGGQPVINPTAPAPPSPGASSGSQDARVAGLQSLYDSTLASLGWGSLNRVPHAQQVQQLAAEAQRAKELETAQQQLQSQAQTLAAQKTAAEQALAEQQFRNTKIVTLAKVNPALIPLADSIVVPVGSDEAAITAAANGFLDSLKALGWSPALAAGSTPAQGVVPVGNQPPPVAQPLPPTPGIPAGAPPAGQLGTIDERIKIAQGRMWDAAGRDPKAYTEAENEYFALLREKTRVEGWVDTKWGKPPGLD